MDLFHLTDNFKSGKFWLDIFLLSVILYRILIAIRPRLLVRITFGVSLLLMLYILSKTLDLATLNWVIDKLYTHIVILLIIIFQPELRHLISELTFTNFPPIIRYFTGRTDLSKAIIPELVASIGEMSEKRIGSIIVLLGNDQIYDIVRRGHRVRTKVTKEFILTIFQKKSSLHDGALVIDDGRIIAAACYLPLSESEIISNKYGARHRSGLGLSEQSDAIVIITSEETGEISLIHKANIVNVKKNELAKLLLNRLT